MDWDTIRQTIGGAALLALILLSLACAWVIMTDPPENNSPDGML